MHDNLYVLPSNFGNCTEERRELGLARELAPKYLLLRALNLKNTGYRSAILSSNADGHGRFNADHALNFALAGEFYASFVPGSTLITSAKSQNLEEAVQNTEVSNIFLIGHSSYHSWCASDKSVDWYDVGTMVQDHLKDGVFVNVGCGGLTSWNQIPLGYFVVNDHQNLFGKIAEHQYSDKLTKVDSLQRLSRLPTFEF